MPQQPLKRVLLSAYACEPERGSEAAVGWNWAIEMSKQFEVVVYTRSSRRPAIEKFFQESGTKLSNLSFEYFDLPPYVLRFKKGTFAMNVYYLLWQFFSFFKVRELHRQQPFDLAHHVSFMSVTRGSFVPFLGIRSIIGPVGGLQTIPSALEDLVERSWVERLRNLGVRFFRWNPLGGWCARKADRLVLANTSNTRFLPNKVLNKSVMGFQIGTEPVPQQVPDFDPKLTVFRWIGRMVDHKGFQILIDVMILFRKIYPEDFAKVKILVSGSGPLKERYIELIEKHELESVFEFLGWLGTDEMDAVWNRTQGFLFTSLRETTGLALIEAMMKGVPPTVIATGGPSEIVTEETGFRVEVQAYSKLVEEFSERIKEYIDQPEAMERLGKESRTRALEDYSWGCVGKKMASIYEDVLN